MTKNSYLKLEIRARMELTGESYSAASRAIARNEPLPENLAGVTPKAKLVHEEVQLHRQVPLLDQIVFIERLQLHLDLAQPIRGALESVGRITDNPELRGAIEAVAEALKENPQGPLPDLLALHPYAFHELLISTASSIFGGGTSMEPVARTLRSEYELRKSSDPSTEGGRSWILSQAAIDALDERPLAIFIGPKAEGQTLAAIRDDWQFLPPLESGLQLNSVLGDRGLDGLPPVQAVFVSDTVLFGKENQSTYLLNRSLDSMADPMVAVISHSPQLRTRIIDTLQTSVERRRLGREIAIFIDPRTPSRDIEEGWGRFQKSLERLKLDRKTEEKLAEPLSPWFEDDDRPTAVFIGPRHVAEVFSRFKPEWRFLHSKDVSDFRNGLSTGKITNDISAVFVVDRFWDRKRKSTELEALAASLSPYAFFGIISYEAELEKDILEAVEADSKSNSYPDGAVFFIDAKRPGSTLESSLEKFLGWGPITAQDAIKKLKGKRTLRDEPLEG